MAKNKINYIWGLLRLSLGWIFFWAFIDKLWGLGFATPVAKSWLTGNSPTLGFLKFAAKGPLAEIFHNLAGNIAVDWLFMLGLAFIGISLLLGICVRLASYTAILMLALIYLAGSIWPANNPFLDEHIIYIIIAIGLTMAHSGQTLGFGRWWARTKLVTHFPILE